MIRVVNCTIPLLPTHTLRISCALNIIVASNSHLNINQNYCTDAGKDREEATKEVIIGTLKIILFYCK